MDKIRGIYLAKTSFQQFLYCLDRFCSLHDPADARIPHCASELLLTLRRVVKLRGSLVLHSCRLAFEYHSLLHPVWILEHRSDGAVMKCETVKLMAAQEDASGGLDEGTWWR